MNIIIPIGGVGKRFSDDGYSLPKPLIKSLGQPVVFWNLENLNIQKDDKVFIVFRDEFENYNFSDTLRHNFRDLNIELIPIKGDTRGSAETVLFAINSMSEYDLNQLTLIVDSDNFYDDDVISLSKSYNSNLIFYNIETDPNPIYSYIDVDDNSLVTNIEEKVKISDKACVGAYCFRDSNLLRTTINSIIKEDRRSKNEFYISNIYKSLIETEYIYSHEIKGFTCLGTPNQLKSFSCRFNSDRKYRFCFDLDNTLVTYPSIDGDYNSVNPIHRNINFINFLHDLGHTTIIYTARRMKTHGGNIGKVTADISKITIDTLDRFNIKYDEIYFGKPYANFYIDDLAISTFSDLEKETGFYNIHPKSRDHNRIEISGKYVVKYSNSISGEKFFYENIPHSISYLFPKMIECGDDYIKITKIDGIPISFLNTNNTLSESVIKSILSKIDLVHNSDFFSGEIDIYQNYNKKMISRVKEYDGSIYPDFESVKNDVISYLEGYESNNRGRLGVIHGDPVFTNILIDNNNNLKFIDMRGKLGDHLTIYGDIFYDYSKMYQSLIGYDHILMDKDIDDDQISQNIEYFSQYIVDKYGVESLIDIKQITKSLILSLIPLHSEKCNSFYELIKNKHLN